MISKVEPDYEHDLIEVSNEAKELLKSLLMKNPNERPTASEVLKHSWFSDVISDEKRISNLINLSKQSSVLNRASKNLIDRRKTKKEGKLSKCQCMKVQNLIDDILRNGIELDVNFDASFHHFVNGRINHSHSLILKKGKGKAILNSKPPNAEESKGED